MSSPYKLSLSSAIMINMNIMLGAGIFLNPVVLSLYAGALSPISYLVVGLLILPLILSLTYLLRRVPGGSFYDFGSQINQLTGFIAAWSYFLGKLASGALMLHFGFSLLQELIPWMQKFNILSIDFIGIIGFTLLNLLGLKTGKYIQLLFMILKVIPIIAIVGIGFFSFNTANFTPSHMDVKGLYITIPLVLYAFTGFEASCSLYRLMANPEKNAPRAVILSFLGVLSMTMLFQMAFYAAVNPDLLMFTPYFDGLSLFLYSTIWSFPAKNVIVWLLQSSVALSALGGSYGILFSVNWNLYILAKEKLTIFSNTFSKLNRFHIAWMCVLSEALLYFIYLFSTKGYQIPLQQLAALGCTVAYAISTLALLFVRIRQQKSGGMITIVAILGMLCCSILLLTTVSSIYKYSLAPLTGYLALLSLGIIMFGYQRRKNTKSLT